MGSPWTTLLLGHASVGVTYACRKSMRCESVGALAVLSALPRLLLATLVLLIGLRLAALLLARLRLAALLLLARTRIARLLTGILVLIGIVRIGHSLSPRGFGVLPRPMR